MDFSRGWIYHGEGILTMGLSPSSRAFGGMVFLLVRYVCASGSETASIRLRLRPNWKLGTPSLTLIRQWTSWPRSGGFYLVYNEESFFDQELRILRNLSSCQFFFSSLILFRDRN